MQYCVKKDTTIVIDGSNNSEEIMLENAIGSGFKVEEVEILTEEEFHLRVNSDLDLIKQNKIREISLICEDKIINEFYSDCLGSKDSQGNLLKDHFDCDDRDQIYIQGLANKATLILNGVQTDGILDWKKTGEPVCYPFTPQSCIQLGLDMFSHISENKKRYEQIREYVLTKLVTSDEVNSVNWDTAIPTI